MEAVAICCDLMGKVQSNLQHNVNDLQMFHWRHTLVGKPIITFSFFEYFLMRKGVTVFNGEAVATCCD